MFNYRKTFKEIQEDLDFKLHSIQKEENIRDVKLGDIGDYLPVGLLINHKKGHNVYMNKISQEILNMDPELIKDLGSNYQHVIMHDKEELNRLKPKIDAYYARNDETEILSFFQKIRPIGSNSFEWMYITSKLLKRDNSFSAEERILIACPVNLMGEMTNKMNQILDENQFMKNNFGKFSRLTKREKEILGLIAQGYDNPTISEMLFISRNTVEQHRKNIRSKIDCSSYAELIKFAITFELVS